MYSRETEIRHISSADVFKLGQILEQTNSWKKLMRIIPKNLSDKLDDNNQKKYNNDHIRLIENASIKQNRMSTEILFEEWGSSGKKRPTVGNLLELLIKAELFRAADFVAISFLNEAPPERPLKGPAAKIDISLPLLSEDIDEIEKILDDTNYPGTRTLLENVQIPSEMNNKDFYEKVTFDDKKIIGSNKMITTTTITTPNDLIKFSTDNITENNIPILSELVRNNDSNTTITSTQLIEFSSTSPVASQSSQIMINGLSPNENANNQIDETNIDDDDDGDDEFESKDIPILSVLQTQHENDYHLPDLSAFNGSDNDDDDVDDELRNDLLSNDSSTSNSSISHESNILTPNLSILDQSGGSNGLNDSSLTNVTDDSSFSCDGGGKQSTTECIQQSDSNIPCISALNN